MTRTRRTAPTARGAPAQARRRPRRARHACALGATFFLTAGAAGGLVAQDPPAAEPPRITVEWVGVPIADVLGAFAEHSGKSIVAGPEVSGFVTAYIADRPWDVALHAILSAHGFVAVEDDHGIVRVRGVGAGTWEDAEDPVLTRTYRLSFAKASELATTLAPHLSERGTISVAASTNSLVISDVARVHRVIGRMIP